MTVTPEQIFAIVVGLGSLIAWLVKQFVKRNQAATPAALPAPAESSDLKAALKALPCMRGEPCKDAVETLVKNVSRSFDEKIEKQTDHLTDVIKKQIGKVVKELGEEP